MRLERAPRRAVEGVALTFSLAAVASMHVEGYRSLIASARAAKGSP